MYHAAVYILYHLLPFYKQEFVNSDSTIYGEVAGHHIILLGKMCCLNLFGEYSFDFRTCNGVSLTEISKKNMHCCPFVN